MTRKRVRKIIPIAAVSVVGGLAAGTVALGQTAPDPGREDIGTVRANGSGDSGDVGASAPDVPQTAAQFAPSTPSLDQIEPTSTLRSETLQKIIVPTENYNDIIRLTPSTQDISPVGPGLQQDFGQSIRGMQYTQFSVLYDGIPIPGFPINFAPQPGTYFTSHDLGAITVHRGPGEASAIGAATFGGFVDLTSPLLSNTPTATAYGTAGSYDTKMYGIEAQTGAISNLNGGRLMIDLENADAGGATSNTSTRKRNGFLKYEQPIGDNTVVTVVANLDHTFTATPYGATAPNIQAFGRNFALNNDPTSQSFLGYNHDDYTTDFEYVGIKSQLTDALSIDNKLYTTSYYQRSAHGLNVGGTGPNLAGTYFVNGTTPVDLTGDVPGIYTKYYFRNTGDVLRLSLDTPYGQARWGVWVEHESFSTSTVQTDDTRDFLAYTTAPGSPFLSDYRSNLNTLQPYVEFAWKPLPNVTVTAGLKYSSVTRTLKGSAGLTGGPQDLSQSYNTPLPSLDANWQVTPWASVYAQAARGYLTPNLNLFSASQITAVNPSTTNSFQVGGVIDRPEFSLGSDLYYIQYENYVNRRTVGGFTTFFNQGGAVYKGVEVEGTVKLPHDLALYANGSLNSSAYDSNGNVLAQTPRRTGVIGLIYDRGGVFHDGDDLYGSVIGKFVGPQYGLDTAAIGQADSIPIKSYSQVDLAAGYTFTVNNRRLMFKVNVYNVMDNRSVIGYGGATAGPPSQPLYFTNPGRSVFFSLAATI
jgi:iron complex outermembrane receptor protein